MSTVWRDEDIAAQDAAWAMSPDGLGILADLVDGPDEDALATATALRRHGLPVARAAALQSIAAASRQAWRDGHPAGTWWTPSAREQASHPAVVAWRSQRYATTGIIDLTAGCGGDALGLAAVSGTLVAQDTDTTRLPLLRANLPDTVTVVAGDARRPAVRPEDWLAWADPARRVAGRRVRGLGATMPAFPELVALGFEGLGVAVSPAVALDDPERPHDAELEFVQVGRDLVEATLWSGALKATGPGPLAATSATILPAGAHHRGDPTGPDTPITDVGEWLVVPAPALVRARLVDQVAQDLGLRRLARSRALFTAQAAVDSPWFASEPVLAIAGARPPRVRQALRTLEDAPVEILLHGVSADMGEWRRGLGAPPMGPQGHAIHVARLDHGSVAIVTSRANQV